jgi:hypothetical protein
MKKTLKIVRIKYQFSNHVILHVTNDVIKFSKLFQYFVHEKIKFILKYTVVKFLFYVKSFWQYVMIILSQIWSWYNRDFHI